MSIDALEVNDDGDNAVELLADTSAVELIEVADLWDLLRSNGLTDKEAEALGLKADGAAQADLSGQNLRNGQRRAQKVMAGKLIVNWKRVKADSLYAPAGWNTVMTSGVTLSSTGTQELRA